MIANYGLLKVNVAIASCAAARVTSVCVSAVGATTSDVILVRRIWYWCRVVTLVAIVACSVRGAVLAVFYKADTVRNLLFSNAVLDGCIVVYGAMYIVRMLK